MARRVAVVAVVVGAAVVSVCNVCSSRRRRPPPLRRAKATAALRLCLPTLRLRPGPAARVPASFGAPEAAAPGARVSIARRQVALAARGEQRAQKRVLTGGRTRARSPHATRSTQATVAQQCKMCACLSCATLSAEHCFVARADVMRTRTHTPNS